MEQYNDLPVDKATFELIFGYVLISKEFSKEYKYTMVESLKKRDDRKYKTTEMLTAPIANVGLCCIGFRVGALGWFIIG